MEPLTFTVEANNSYLKLLRRLMPLRLRQKFGEERLSELMPMMWLPHQSHRLVMSEKAHTKLIELEPQMIEILSLHVWQRHKWEETS